MLENIENFNSYITGIDCSLLNTFFTEEGEKREYKRKEYFLRQGDTSRFLGLVDSGAFRYTHIDVEGDEHIVGYCFPKEYVTDYSSLINKMTANIDIQAINNCTVYVISYDKLLQFWEKDMETQRLGRQLAEKVFTQSYLRWLNSFCSSPEQRYRKLMQQCPGIENHIPLKEIASFINVTPETVSHIRKKMLFENKS